jgi:transposase
MDSKAVMALMLDSGWSLRNIAAHFGKDIKIVEKLIVESDREEREAERSDARAGRRQ